jgi:hypothetical protein
MGFSRKRQSILVGLAKVGTTLSHCPFIGAGGAPERGGRGVTMALMALTPLKVGARLRGRIKEGEMMAGW